MPTSNPTTKKIGTQMRHRSFFTSMTLGVSGVLLLSSCSAGGNTAEIEDKSADFGFQADGLPIVTDTLSLSFGGTKSALAPDYEDMALVQQWEADTNIAINWKNL